RRLEPNRTRAQDGIFHQPNHSLLLKISLRGPVLANRCKQILQLTLGKRGTLCDRRQRESKEDSIDEGAHALILCGGVKFSKCIVDAADADRDFSEKPNQCMLFNDSSARLGNKMLKCRD